MLKPRNQVWAIVPVKEFRHAKHRLADILTADERVEFAQAMLLDVLECLVSCEQIDQVLVVTRQLLDAHYLFGGRVAVIPEGDAPDLNLAVQAGLNLAAHQKIDTALIVPGDVPLLSAKELGSLLSAHCAGRDERLTLVPSEYEGGTNLMLASPPGLIKPQYGEASFVAHQTAIETSACQLQVVMSPTIGLDVDRARDVQRLGRLLEDSSSAPRTRSFFERTHVLERFRPRSINKMEQVEARA